MWTTCFGYGWNLSLFNIHLTSDVAKTGDLADIGIYQPFRYGNRVYITTPDGARHGFSFTPIAPPPPPDIGSAGQFGSQILRIHLASRVDRSLQAPLRIA